MNSSEHKISDALRRAAMLRAARKVSWRCFRPVKAAQMDLRRDIDLVHRSILGHIRSSMGADQ